MTLVDWAHLVLPLCAFAAGGYFIWLKADAIDQWVRRLDATLEDWASR